MDTKKEKKHHAKESAKKGEEPKKDNSAGDKSTQEQRHPLAEQLEKTKKDLAAAEDKYLRLYAEFDNFRKRTETEKNEFAKFANKSLIEAFLVVWDSFEHSKTAFEKNSANNLDEVQKGFALIHKQFEDILFKFGVKKIEAIGKKFDPNFHEAVMQKEADAEPQTVVEEMQAGFMLHDKLLRPAMVIVAK